MKKKISIIGIVGLPSNYGGFETLADNITKSLSANFDFTVYCSRKSYTKKITRFNNSNLKYINFYPNGYGSIFYDALSMLKSVRNSDIMLILGVSGAILLPFIRLISRSKIIVHIDGCEWKRDKWNFFAKRFLKFSERIAIKFSHEIIADNPVIVNYVKSKFNKDSNLISYGSDHVISSKELSIESLKNKYPFISSSYSISVCRIVPENNIELILNAFTKLKDINIAVIGNWDNNLYSQGLRDKFKSYENIFLIDSIFDQKLLDTLRVHSSFYIHGHSAGGTNPSLVEAMYLGLPVICYDVNYNRETTSGSALFFKTSNDLIDLMNNTSKKDLNTISKRLKVIAKEKYLWGDITEKYSLLFNKS